MDNRVRENIQLAQQFGWKPADFGKRKFTERLVARIEEFQGERFLPVTGLGDYRTIRALRAFKAAKREAKKSKFTKPPVKFGGVQNYDPQDPKVLRSEPFTGKILWLSSLDEPDESVTDFFDGLAVHISRAKHHSGRVIPIVAARGRKPWAEGRRIAEELLDIGATCFILYLSEHAFPDILDNDGEPLSNLLDAIEARTDMPKAVASSWRPKTQRGADPIEWRRAWRHIGRFDLALPLLPGPSFRPEDAAGTSSAVWSIYAQVPLGMQIPVFAPPEGYPPNYLLRMRAWLDMRAYRGAHWMGPLEGPLWEAFTTDYDPDSIERIDYTEKKRSEPNRVAGRARRQAHRAGDERGADSPRDADQRPQAAHEAG